MSEKELLVLLTNDDGGRAPGLQSLKREMETTASVVMVAPDEERSAASHALTIHDPIRVMEVSENNYLLTGTPADCVIFGSSGKWGGAASQRQAVETAALCKPWKNN